MPTLGLRPHQLLIAVFLVVLNGFFVAAEFALVKVRIIGSVEDEFDTEPPEIIPDGSDQWIIRGSASLVDVNRELNLTLSSSDADTLSGLLVATMERLLRDGDEIELNGAFATVLKRRGERAERVRVQLVRKNTKPKRNLHRMQTARVCG